MATLTRKELKTDKVSQKVTGLAEFLLNHKQKLLQAGAAALLLTVAGLGIFYYQRSIEAAAGEALGGALVTFHGVVTTTPPVDITVPVFDTAEKKFQQARQEFQDVAKTHSGTKAADWAQLYAALSLRELDQLSEAESELNQITNNDSRELAAQAKMALAGIYHNTNRTSEAEKLYKELIDGSLSVTVPKPTVQMSLASLYLRTDPDQAMRMYQQMSEEYSGTVIGDVVNDLLENRSQ